MYHHVRDLKGERSSSVCCANGFDIAVFSIFRHDVQDWDSRKCRAWLRNRKSAFKALGKEAIKPEYRTLEHQATAKEGLGFIPSKSFQSTIRYQGRGSEKKKAEAVKHSRPHFI